MNDIKSTYTTEELADHLLRDKYWANYFTHSKPNVNHLSFDISQLNSNARDVVLWALDTWSKVVDISFEETTINPDIKFISSSDGYICNPRYDHRNYMEINLDQKDVEIYDSGKGTILSHNALHEIGHALGLSHAGPYNGGNPIYGIDNDCANDSFLTTIMSYYSQLHNTTTDASFGYCATPMVADIVAVQKIYGAPAQYIKNDVYVIEVKQKYYPFIQTIYDSGGHDLLDLSLIGRVDNNYIDLNEEAWSSIGGYKKNVTIARDTVIESVVGSNSNDAVIGNSADNILYESTGNDYFNGAQGLDTVIYNSSIDDHKIYRFENETIVYDTDNHKRDLLLGVEALHFSDQKIDLLNVQKKSILEYTASYNDLIKTIGSNVEGSIKHFYDYGLLEGRNITFEPYLYLGSYDDLRKSFGSDRAAAARHYIDYGFEEGRSPDAFKSLEYIASHEDLIKDCAHTADLVQAGKDHFTNFGLLEGRNITFEPYLYLGSYDDLRKSFGSDKVAATRHYINSGFEEGRSPDAFKSLEYIASHEDLIKAYAHTADLVQVGKDHFTNFGLLEGRNITFEPYLYLDNYDDLRKSFGSDRDAATRHYIDYGFAEGRILSSIPSNIGLSEELQNEFFGNNESHFDNILQPTLDTMHH
ncbi:M10 family metallopeptidase C-terminal domain-containing protein [Candidatus Liberibacter africanus]|uniref:M10 family metallopeptidase C-terminal domain-containing protein n=1 Tax=Liberibacter africanus TaxID=34020 RepID=UPI001FD5075D|nr:M10 family metallopeptidase C-terminal domain-containing protein [Candidatus Liberibacter africanus]